MKPNFALDLSHSSVALLHRTDASKDGWNLVGEVQLDDPDLAATLAMLRKTAAELDQSGMACKLIIPNSEILYTELEAPGADDIAREVQIRKALEGLTPYDVSELVFDWRRSKGKKVKVAVVARVTLQEAEGFARENRLNPVSFVARPAKGFKGEAFFGMASGASALLGPGQTVEPDEKPVPVLKAPKTPKADVDDLADDVADDVSDETAGRADADSVVEDTSDNSDQDSAASAEAVDAPEPEETAAQPEKPKTGEKAAQKAAKKARKKLPPIPPRRTAPGVLGPSPSSFAPGSVPMPSPAVPPASESVTPPVAEPAAPPVPPVETAPPVQPSPAVQPSPVVQPTPAPEPAAPVQPERVSWEDEDARIAALLAEVPDPSFVSARKRRSEPEPGPTSGKPGNEDAKGRSTGSAKPSRTKKPADVPPAPVLAPFPPTLDGTDPIAAKAPKEKPPMRRKQARTAAKAPDTAGADTATKKPADPAKKTPPPPPRRQAQVPGAATGAGQQPISPSPVRAQGDAGAPASRAIAAAGAAGPSAARQAGAAAAKPQPSFTTRRGLWKNPLSAIVSRDGGKHDQAKAKPAQPGMAPLKRTAGQTVTSPKAAPSPGARANGKAPGAAPRASHTATAAAKAPATPVSSRAAQIATAARSTAETLTRSAKSLISRGKPKTNAKGIPASKGSGPAGSGIVKAAPGARRVPQGTGAQAGRQAGAQAGPQTGHKPASPTIRATQTAPKAQTAGAGAAPADGTGKLSALTARGLARLKTATASANAPAKGTPGKAAIPAPKAAPTAKPGTARQAQSTRAAAPAAKPGERKPQRAAGKTAQQQAQKQALSRKETARAKAAVATPVAPSPPLPGKKAGIGTPISATAEEAERLTLFGARKSQKPGGDENRRFLGLAASLVGLLILAVIALAWVFFLRGDGTKVAVNDQFAAASVPGALLPDGADAQPGPDAIGAQTLSDEAAQARYAATGVWEKAPEPPAEPQTDRIDDLYIAAIDPEITGHDAVALPEPNQEPVPDAPLPPPPPGVRFKLDENGMVTPSRRGTLAPEGFKVFSGRPPEVAPARPEPPEGFLPTPEPAPEAAAPGAQVPGAGAVEPPPLGIQPNEALREFRPVPRPASLIEENQRANNGGNTLLELAAFKPAPRPELTGVAAESIAQAIALATADAALATADEAALAASPVPGHRPGNFQAVVDSAVATSGSDGSTVMAASAAATTIPAIPTRANVATQATMNNAIRLNKVNLIGIYGSSSSRRALVRLPNGRYIKVSVGDRLDGGKVVSITDSQVIYTKKGRNYTLGLIPL